MSDGAGNVDRPASSLAPERFQSLNQQVSSASLKSSNRIVILILLAMNKTSTATELRTLTGLSRGSLQNHLEKLASAGYVKTKNVKSFGGWRQTVEITQAGIDVCRELLRTIQALNV